MKCRTYAQPNADNGEGWDGECGNCADVRSRRSDGGRTQSGLDRTYCDECSATLEEGQVGKCDDCSSELEICPYCGIAAETVCDSLPPDICERAIEATYGKTT